MLFKSSHPDIDGELVSNLIQMRQCNVNSRTVPENIPLWDWLFASERPAFNAKDSAAAKGFVNADTSERLTLDEIRKSSTWLSTALVKDHGLKQ